MELKIYKSEGLIRFITDLGKEIKNDQKGGLLDKLRTFVGNTKELCVFLKGKGYKMDCDEFASYCKSEESILNNFNRGKSEQIELSDENLSKVTGGLGFPLVPKPKRKDESDKNDDN